MAPKTIICCRRKLDLGPITSAAAVPRGRLRLEKHIKLAGTAYGVWIPSSRRFGTLWDDGVICRPSHPLPHPTTRIRYPQAFPGELDFRVAVRKRDKRTVRLFLKETGRTGWLAKVRFGGSGKGILTKNWMNPMRPWLRPGIDGQARRYLTGLPIGRPFTNRAVTTVTGCIKIESMTEPSLAGPVAGTDPAKAQANSRPWSVCIVVELDNIRTSAKSRAQKLFQSLRHQVENLPATEIETIDLNVVHDPDHVPTNEVEAFLANAQIRQWAWGTVTIIPATGARYYDQKNIGAAACAADIVVFLDSDLDIDDGWLRNILSPFQDPAIHFVCGETRFETKSFYEKSFALLYETFPIKESPVGGLIEQPYFLANSVAYRTSTFGKTIFPNGETFRGQCHTASINIRDAGHHIFMQTEAKARHPAPNGPGHFFARALVAGHDEMVHIKSLNDGSIMGWLKASPIGASWRLLKSLVTAWGRCIECRKVVDLPISHLPAAMGIATVYYGVSFVSELVTFFDARLIRQVATH